MEVKELGHLVLYVRDLAKSAAFYRDVLGWRPVDGDGPLAGAVAFSSGRTHHELLLIEDVQAVGDGVIAGTHDGNAVSLHRLEGGPQIVVGVPHFEANVIEPDPTT